ncbi:hypothetical protein [Zeimonas arvi]|uniref:Uncharacterized protein n=1 Tax=Zeimonas arvi TaxID=2498847 RepID=A0A5C8NN21_9BURK|nr:hypothetical protein [Zeimonas arvi]TXL62662.1 hypothetical protein FHP08_17720 [Zeimonas arvi]
MPAAHVIKAPPGLGKTTGVINQVAAAGQGTVEIYVPTHALGLEIEKKLRGANPALRVQVISGRSHIAANGLPMCAKAQVAEEVARSGADVYASLCERKTSKGFQQCDHFASCPYIQQFRSGARVTIYTHAHLSKRRTKLDPPVPDWAIIDESFWQSCIDIFSIPISLLRAPFLGTVSRKVCLAVHDALKQQRPLYATLTTAGIHAGEIEKARRELRSQRGAPKPTMSEPEQRAAAHAMRDRSMVRRLVECLWRESFADRPTSHAIVYESGTGMVTVHVAERISRFDEGNGLKRGAPNPNNGMKSSKVLVIDGSANREIIKQFMAITRFEQIAANRKARVVQCTSTRCSTTSLVPERNTSKKNKAAARKRLAQLEKFLARLAAEHERVLVVGPTAITGNPRTQAMPLIKVPANIDLAHFGAIRGIDRWKDHNAIVVIGRNEPPITAVEELARAVFFKSPEAIGSVPNWSTEVRGVRARGRKFGVDVVRHPDDRVQAVLEQLREAESEQAIDRLRLVHCATPKEVYLLSNIPLDVDVDELVDWDDLMEGRRVEQAFSQLSGVLPLSGEWLAQRFPRLWRTRAAAERDVARWRKDRQSSKRTTIGKLSVVEHEYRPAASKQRAWSRCVSRHPSPDATRVELEALLGQLVLMRGAPSSASPPGREPLALLAA